MTLIYYQPRMLQHDTGSHPEQARRLEAIVEHFDRQNLWHGDLVRDWPAVTEEQVGRVHDLGYLRSVQQLAERGGGQLDADTVVSQESYEVAMLAAGAGIDAVSHILRGPAKQALCLVRPPGHHALAGTGMGFCLVNNIAVAASVAMAEHALERVLIVDWDVHHGNGTQAIFYEEPRVGFFSSHRWPFYPGTGAADEQGAGSGVGTTRNLPFEFGVSRSDFLAEFERSLQEFADHIRPELVLISAGFDAHRADPVGSLGLETEDFATLTEIVLNVAQQHAQGRVVSLLEGGYNPPVLAECVAAHLVALRTH